MPTSGPRLTVETLTDSYTYTVSDGTVSRTATLTITIFGTNDAPVANADTNWAQEDVANASGNVLQTLLHPDDPSTTLSFSDVADTDVDGDNLTVTAFNGNIGHGTLALGTTGAYTYTLDNGNADVQALDDGETLTDSYTYTVSDGTVSRTATLTITIFGTNDAPVANADTNWAQEDVANASGNVLQTLLHPDDPSTTLSFSDVADTDVDGDNLTVTAFNGNIGHGTLALGTTGAYTYTLDNGNADVQALDDGETLTDSYTYTVSDGTVSRTATLTITIFGTNDAPVANADTNWAQEDVANASGNVLQTLLHPDDPSTTLSFSDIADTDVDGDNLTVTAFNGNIGHGTLALGTTGAYTYTLDNGNADVQALDDGETLTDSYTYTVSDGTVSRTATLTITIFGTNDAPVANADTNWAQEDVANASGNVLQTLLHPDDPSTTLSFSDVADTDVDGDNLTVTAFNGNIGHGTLALGTTGAYTYTLDNGNADVQALDDGETLTDSYTYTVSDGTVSRTATLTITIFGTNDAPVANADTNWAQEDVANASGNVLQTLLHPDDPSTTLSFSDVADTDVDGDNLTVTAFNGNIGHGTLALGTTGAYTYTLDNGNADVQALDDGETLTDSYTYTVSDGTVSRTATLTITIFGTNDGPSLVVADATGDKVYESGLPTGSGVVPNDIVATGKFTIGDTDGLDDIKSITLGSKILTIGSGGGEFADLLAMVGQTFNTTNGTVLLTGYSNGEFTYSFTLTSRTTDLANQLETNSFNVSVSDGSASASDTITIEIVHDLPLMTIGDTFVYNADGSSNTGAQSIIFGADGPALTSPVLLQATSGLPVGYSLVSVGVNTWNAVFGTTAADSSLNTDLFSIVMNPADNTYTFTLLNEEPPTNIEIDVDNALTSGTKYDQAGNVITSGDVYR